MKKYTRRAKRKSLSVLFENYMQENPLLDKEYSCQQFISYIYKFLEKTDYKDLFRELHLSEDLFYEFIKEIYSTIEKDLCSYKKTYLPSVGYVYSFPGKKGTIYFPVLKYQNRNRRKINPVVQIEMSDDLMNMLKKNIAELSNRNLLID